MTMGVAQQKLTDERVRVRERDKERMTNNRSFAIIVTIVENYCKLFQEAVFLSTKSCIYTA